MAQAVESSVLLLTVPAPWIWLSVLLGGAAVLLVPFLFGTLPGRPPDVAPLPAGKVRLWSVCFCVSLVVQAHHRDRPRHLASGSLPLQGRFVDVSTPPARSGEFPSAPDRRSAPSTMQDPMPHGGLCAVGASCEFRLSSNAAACVGSHILIKVPRSEVYLSGPACSMADQQSPPPSEVATASDALSLILSCQDKKNMVALRNSVSLADLARLHDLVGSRVFTELVNFVSPFGADAPAPSMNTNNAAVCATPSDATWGVLPDDGRSHTWADASDPPSEVTPYHEEYPVWEDPGLSPRTLHGGHILTCSVCVGRKFQAGLRCRSQWRLSNTSP